jgi:serine/threonine protein kinase
LSNFISTSNAFVKRQDKEVSETLHWKIWSRVSNFGYTNFSRWNHTPDCDPAPATDTMTINSYELHTPIGGGTTGTVYSATSHGHPFAVKVIQRDPKTQNIIRREVKALKGIRAQLQEEAGYHYLQHLHKLIPADGGEEDLSSGQMGSVYFVLKPLPEETLADVIASSRSRRDKMRLFHEAVKGVALLHTKGWVHRDLRPENIGIV